MSLTKGFIRLRLDTIESWLLSPNDSTVTPWRVSIYQTQRTAPYVFYFDTEEEATWVCDKLDDIIGTYNLYPTYNFLDYNDRKV